LGDDSLSVPEGGSAGSVLHRVIGGIPALVMLVSRRARFTDEIPYGPPMLAGAWVALVFGEAFGRMITG
jgi:leader peptidase (prepilin peptidase) / N-methyltransferase